MRPAYSFEQQKILLITQLPAIKINKKHVDAELSCCICLSDFEKGEVVKQLPKCPHIFHLDCLVQWLKDTPTCPLCRIPVFTNDIDPSTPPVPPPAPRPPQRRRTLTPEFDIHDDVEFRPVRRSRRLLNRAYGVMQPQEADGESNRPIVTLLSVPSRSRSRRSRSSNRNYNDYYDIDIEQFLQ